jgi:hypothetical protein
MSAKRGRQFCLRCCLLAGLGVAVAVGSGGAQPYEYVITFDNVVVEGNYMGDTPAVAHRDAPVEAQRNPPGEVELESPSGSDPERLRGTQREPPGIIDRELLGGARREMPGADGPSSSPRRETDRVEGGDRTDGPSPRTTNRASRSEISFTPGKGILNPSFVQEGFLVEAFWAVKTGTSEAYFKRAHFHPPDLSSGFEAQHLGNRRELHGIFIRSVDGKPFGLKSLLYRVTRNRELPNKPISIEGFSNFNVSVLVARSFDPRGPIRGQFVSFPVGLPVGNATSLPWWTLRIFGFELVSQVYIASSASVDFDNIVLTRSGPPPVAPERREEDK